MVLDAWSRRIVGWAMPHDNATCESFFATLEGELLDRQRFRTAAEAQREVFGFIEGFHNTRRIHSALGYQAPANYEEINRAARSEPAPERPTARALSHPLGGDNRTHIRPNQPQELTVRESGAGPLARARRSVPSLAPFAHDFLSEGLEVQGCGGPLARARKSPTIPPIPPSRPAHRPVGPPQPAPASGDAVSARPSRAQAVSNLASRIGRRAPASHRRPPRLCSAANKGCSPSSFRHPRGVAHSERCVQVRL